MKKILLILTAILFIYGCSSGGKKKDGLSGTSYKLPEKFNLQFIGYNTNIDDPKNDRRSYYKIILNKIEEGRTTFGLESQAKIFEAAVEPNRHLMTVEKWVLDEKANQYVKLNNIDQPKPNFIYFNTEKDRIVIIEMKEGRNGRSDFSVDFKLKD